MRIMKHVEYHPNIINLYGVAFKDIKPIIIVELAVNNLADYLATKKDNGEPVDWATKTRFCCEMADGLPRSTPLILFMVISKVTMPSCSWLPTTRTS